MGIKTTKELREMKINQFKDLYKVSKETKQETQKEYALKAIMAFKGDLTDEMLKDLKKMFIGRRDIRHPLAYGGDGYVSKWVYGEYQPMVTGKAVCQKHEIEETYGNTQYKSDVDDKLIEVSANEIVGTKQITELQEEIYKMDKRCGREKTFLGKDFVDKVKEGEYLIYQITTSQVTVEKEFGYIIVMGIPGKKGYIVVTIIDTDHCNKCHINSQSIAHSITSKVKAMLKGLNTAYEVKSKEVI